MKKLILGLLLAASTTVSAVNLDATNPFEVWSYFNNKCTGIMGDIKGGKADKLFAYYACMAVANVNFAEAIRKAQEEAAKERAYTEI